MRNDALIRIYTRPLFDLAVETQSIPALGEELQTLAILYEQVPALSEYLDSPNVIRSAKLELLKKAYDKPWSKFFTRFLELVLRKGRQEILPFAFEAYKRYWDEHQALLNVTVTTPIELTDAQKQAISEKLTQRTGKKIVLKCSIDVALLGGIRLQIGHQMLDASAAGRLSALREELLRT